MTTYNLEISGEQYGSNDLIGFVATQLSELGVNSFQAIQVDAGQNKIDIQFDDLNDSKIVHAINGTHQRFNTHTFTSNNARQFLLELYETSNQAAYS